MSISTGGTDMIGGGSGYGFGGGGFGGIAPIGLIGLNTFLGGRGGFGNEGFNNGPFPGGGVVGSTVAEQNISNIREEIGTLGNEMQVAFSAANINNANNFRALDNQICGINQNLSNLNYAQTLQNMQNTQSIKDQATANQMVAAENACAIKGLIQAEADNTRSLVHAETDRVIALINATETQNLRDRILELTRSGDRRETEINITNTATATQSQVQAQLQSQNQFLATMFNSLGDQVNRAANSVVQVGTGLVSGPQDNTQNNTKVNS